MADIREEVIKDRSHLVLKPEEFDALSNSLENPPIQNKALDQFLKKTAPDGGK